MRSLQYSLFIFFYCCVTLSTKAQIQASGEKKPANLSVVEVRQLDKSTFAIEVSTDSDQPLIFESDNEAIAYVKDQKIYIDHDVPGEAFIYVYQEGNDTYKVAHKTFVAHIITQSRVASGLDDKLNNEVVLYPNPVTNNVAMIKTDASVIIDQVKVYNQRQQLQNPLIESQRGEIVIYTDELHSGTYIVKIQTNKGLVIRQMIVK